MSESKKKWPNFDSVERLTAYFDENDVGDFIDDMRVVEFDVDLKRRTHYVAIEGDIAGKLSEISKHEHVSSGVIVNSWLREKISDYTRK